MTNPPTVTNEVDELAQKKQFAIELLKDPSKPFIAACAVFRDDTGTALKIAGRWPTDPDVLRFQAEAVDAVGDMHFLPTKAEAARLAFSMASDDKATRDDRLRALRLYADIRGFIEKQSPIINNNILTNNKVMVVKDHGSVDAWEDRLMQQQSKLIDDANAPRIN